MIEYASGDEVYGVQYIKKLISDRYNEHISFCSEPGKENIIYFKEMADYLINSKFRERGSTTNEESERIIALAANLIKAEIREKEFKHDFYPNQSDIEGLNWSPPLLRQLMNSLTKSEISFSVYCEGDQKRCYTTITICFRYRYHQTIASVLGGLCHTCLVLGFL